MDKPISRVEERRFPVSSALFIIRLGGAAGLLGVVLALTQGLLEGVSLPVIEKILQASPNLAVVVWIAGVYAFQSPHLGRLGLLGTIGAMTGLTAVTLLNLLGGNLNASTAEWLKFLLAGPATPVLFTVLAVSYVWGVLALGTTSLQLGSLPRGAVVLWMLGLMAIFLTSWFPVPLVAITGILWTSVILLRGTPRKDTDQVPDAMPVVPTRENAINVPGRLIPLDALRGTIMALMAIDHASYFIRRWHPFETWDQPLPDYPSLAAMFTRLVTHPSAPGFFFLMGAGMIFFANARRKYGWSDRKIAGQMALRGLLLIALEQLIVDVASAGQVYPLEFSILTGLGVAMIFGIFFLRLGTIGQFITGAMIILIMQILPGILLSADLGVFEPIRLLLLPGSVGRVFVLYPPVPWLGVTLLGMAFARLLQQRQDKAYQVAGITGLVFLALFPIVRFLGGFGNLRMPTGDTLIDFFNVIKYPPSLSFLLISLGFDLVLLYLFSRLLSHLVSWARPVVVLGKAALYFFLAHWFVYGAMGIAWNEPGGIPKTYLVWAVGLVLLYPVCKTFEAFKHGMAVNSVWRML